MSRRLLLAAFLFHPGGAHVTGWRHPSAGAERHLEPSFYREFARTAERGTFDTIFLADGLYLWDRYPSGIDHYSQVRFEPLTLLSALAAVTEHIGLAATVSTTYNHPYHVARALASLDHVSRGRAAWNLVTSRYDEEARNFGGDAHLDHADRYRRGAEFVDAVHALLDSWADDAILADRESGLFADRARVSTPDIASASFRIRGPLNVARPPQGHPVLFQAGGSPSGVTLAAATADAVFARPLPLEEATAFARDLKAKAAALGRDERTLSVLPALRPVVGRSRSEAEDLAEEILASTPDALVLEDVAHTLGQDLTGRGADEAFAYDPTVDTSNESRSRSPLVEWVAERRTVTAREVYARGFRESVVVGTASDIADDMEERFTAGAADGFVVQSLTLPRSLEDFVDLVVPELRRRGLTRSRYGEATLRERFGLDRPERVVA